MATPTKVSPAAKPAIPKPKGCVTSAVVVVKGGKVVSRSGSGRPCPSCGQVHVELSVVTRPGEAVEVEMSAPLVPAAATPARASAPPAAGRFKHKMFTPDADPVPQAVADALAAWLRSGGRS